jgi:hypothetical protein
VGSGILRFAIVRLQFVSRLQNGCLATARITFNEDVTLKGSLISLLV